jgi:hypothetical protein
LIGVHWITQQVTFLGYAMVAGIGISSGLHTMDTSISAERDMQTFYYGVGLHELNLIPDAPKYRAAD